MGPPLQATQAYEQDAKPGGQCSHHCDHKIKTQGCSAILSWYLQQLSHTVSPARGAEHDRHACTCIWNSIGLGDRLGGLFRLRHLLIAQLQQQAHDLGALALGILLTALFSDGVVELLQLPPDSLQCQPLCGKQSFSATAATVRIQTDAVG